MNMNNKPFRQIRPLSPQPVSHKPAVPPAIQSLQQPLSTKAHITTAPTANPYTFRVNSLEEVNLLLAGLDLIQDNRAVVLPDLKRRLNALAVEFKAHSSSVVKSPARQLPKGPNAR